MAHVQSYVTENHVALVVLCHREPCSTMTCWFIFLKLNDTFGAVSTSIHMALPHYLLKECSLSRYTTLFKPRAILSQALAASYSLHLPQYAHFSTEEILTSEITLSRGTDLQF